MTMVDPAPTGQEAAYRLAMGRFTSGVCVATTVLDGVDYSMTVAAVCSLSLDPLLFGVSISRQARFHDLARSSGVLGLSILSESQLDLAERMGAGGRPAEGQLDGVDITRGAMTDVALLTGCQATLEGPVAGTHPAGDHTFFMVNPVGVDMPDVPTAPLVHYGRDYRSLA